MGESTEPTNKALYELIESLRIEFRQRMNMVERQLADIDKLVGGTGKTYQEKMQQQQRADDGDA